MDFISETLYVYSLYRDVCEYISGSHDAVFIIDLKYYLRIK